MEGTDIFPTKFHDNSWLYIPNQRLKGDILELKALPKTHLENHYQLLIILF